MNERSFPSNKQTIQTCYSNNIIAKRVLIYIVKNVHHYSFCVCLSTNETQSVNDLVVSFCSILSKIRMARFFTVTDFEYMPLKMNEASFYHKSYTLIIPHIERRRGEDDTHSWTCALTPPTCHKSSPILQMKRPSPQLPSEERACVNTSLSTKR